MDLNELPIPEVKRSIFQRALQALESTGVAFSLGGGLALYYYTGVQRDVHDLDLHLLPRDVEPSLAALREAGFTTWVHLAPWLAQATVDQVQVDLVYGQGSGHASVDQRWFAGPRTHFLGHEVTITAPEEFFWSKSMRYGRYRSDAPDLFSTLVALGDRLDWPHLLDLFDEDWEVLLSHLVVFRYAFPSHAGAIPDEILDNLLERLQASRRSSRPPHPPVWRKGLIDSATDGQYFEERGYIDERRRRWERRLSAELDVLAPLVAQDIHRRDNSGGSHASD